MFEAAWAAEFGKVRRTDSNVHQNLPLPKCRVSKSSFAPFSNGKRRGPARPERKLHFLLWSKQFTIINIAEKFFKQTFSESSLGILTNWYTFFDRLKHRRRNVSACGILYMVVINKISLQILDDFPLYAFWWWLYHIDENRSLIHYWFISCQ